MRSPLSRVVLLGCAAAAYAAAAAEAPLRDPFTSPFETPKPAATNASPAAVRVPGPVAPAAAAPDLGAELRAALHVQGFFEQGGRRYVMINERLVSAGDVVQVRLGETVRRFRVREVSATTVNFDPLP